MKTELTIVVSRKQKRYMPTTLEDLVKIDVDEYKKKENEAAVVVTKEETVNEDGTTTTTTTSTTTTTVETIVVKKTGKGDIKPAKGTEPLMSTPAKSDVCPEPSTRGTLAPVITALGSNDSDQDSICAPPCHENYGDAAAPVPEPKAKVDIPHQSSDTVVVGLKIYTDKDVKCPVLGRLRTGCKDPNCSNCAPPTIVTVPAVTTVLTTV